MNLVCIYTTVLYTVLIDIYIHPTALSSGCLFCVAKKSKKRDRKCKDTGPSTVDPADSELNSVRMPPFDVARTGEFFPHSLVNL